MYTFGKAQLITSPRMQACPELARLLYLIFGYTSVGNYARAEIFKKLMAKLPTYKFREILDLGCGFGEYSFMLSEGLPHAKITAIDVLPDRVGSVKRAKEKLRVHNLTVRQSKIEDLAESTDFDFIFSVDVFEHIKKEEMPFGEAFKRLKEDGYLLIKMPNIQQQTFLPEGWFEEHNEWLEHEHVGQVYDLQGLQDRFLQEGFSVEYAAYADGPLSRIAWEIGYLAKQQGTLLQLLLLPFCKGLVKLDTIFPQRKKGNTIQVIGRKIARN